MQNTENLKESWRSFAEHGVKLGEFDGLNFSPSFVKAMRGAPLAPVAIPDVLAPKLRRVLIQSAHVAAALHFLEPPDPYTAAAVSRLLTLHDHPVLSYADAVAAARDVIKVAAPVPDQRGANADAVASRAWVWLHLVSHWRVQDAIGLAAERAGLYTAAAVWIKAAGGR